MSLKISRKRTLRKWVTSRGRANSVSKLQRKKKKTIAAQLTRVSPTGCKSTPKINWATVNAWSLKCWLTGARSTSHKALAHHEQRAPGPSQHRENRDKERHGQRHQHPGLCVQLRQADDRKFNRQPHQGSRAGRSLGLLRWVQETHRSAVHRGEAVSDVLRRHHVFLYHKRPWI